MQPARPARRQIEVQMRPGRPLDYRRLSDPILVRRSKDGDAQALQALCERHVPAVERLCVRFLHDSEDARDAAQEAMAKLCTRVRQFRGESLFSTWLHRLAVNTCRDVAARNRLRRSEPLGDAADDLRADEPATPAAELAELRSQLGCCLATLPPVQARVVVLKDALDFSFAEIAEATGLPVGTAKCYAHRARAGLRRRLEAAAGAA